MTQLISLYITSKTIGIKRIKTETLFIKYGKRTLSINIDTTILDSILENNGENTICVVIKDITSNKRVKSRRVDYNKCPKTDDDDGDVIII